MEFLFLFSQLEEIVGLCNGHVVFILGYTSYNQGVSLLLDLIIHRPYVILVY